MNNKGLVLASAIIFTIALAALAAGVLMLSANSYRMIKTQNKREKAFMLAKAGIRLVGMDIKDGGITANGSADYIISGGATNWTVNTAYELDTTWSVSSSATVGSSVRTVVADLDTNGSIQDWQ